ncbi:MAG TPA: hypothetical protein VFY90_06175 [Tepidiformaceae bacterium]|nr:hypothetical protein [Tepidiformaceae bacterium]
MITKLSTYPMYDGHRSRIARQKSARELAASVGSRISSTSSVIAIAITPSLNVSRRAVFCDSAACCSGLIPRF